MKSSSFARRCQSLRGGAACGSGSAPRSTTACKTMRSLQVSCSPLCEHHHDMGASQLCVSMLESSVRSERLHFECASECDRPECAAKRILDTDAICACLTYDLHNWCACMQPQQMWVGLKAAYRYASLCLQPPNETLHQKHGCPNLLGPGVRVSQPGVQFMKALCESAPGVPQPEFFYCEIRSS